MRNILLAGVAVVAIVSGQALAADLPPQRAPAPPPIAPVVVEPVFSWTGFYVGANAGYAWGKSDFDSVFSCPNVVGCAFVSPANLAFISALGTGSAKPNGFTGGGQAGFNVQTGPLVLGIEADFNAFNLHGTRSTSGLLPAGVGQTATVTTAIDTNWLFTLRGRLGWSVTPTLLIYGTGGLAGTGLKLSNSYVDDGVGAPSPVAGNSSKSGTVWGWTVGGGLEWAFYNHWTFKAEYLYVDFGSVSTTANVAPPPNFNLIPDTLVTSAVLKAHIARAGINYKF